MPTSRDFAATHHLAVGSTGAGSVALAGLGLSMGTAQAFDPQPDPPGKVAPSHRVNPGEIHGFNPQPEPPGLPASVAQRGLIRRRSRRGPCGLWTSGRSGHVIRWP
jgi:hypothetical protein